MFNLTRLCVPHLRGGGAIINTASVNSKRPTPNILPYSATKGAVANLTLGLAGLLAEHQIRVNAVLPGPIWTPFIPAGMAPKRSNSSARRRRSAARTAGRAGLGLCDAGFGQRQLYPAHC